MDVKGYLLCRKIDHELMLSVKIISDIKDDFFIFTTSHFKIKRISKKQLA